WLRSSTCSSIATTFSNACYPVAAGPADSPRRIPERTLVIDTHSHLHLGLCNEEVDIDVRLRVQRGDRTPGASSNRAWRHQRRRTDRLSWRGSGLRYLRGFHRRATQGLRFGAKQRAAAGRLSLPDLPLP